MRTRYDVLICGAGPAGSAAGIALARLGLSVCLVESTAAGRGERAGETAAPEIAASLIRLGTWEAFRAQGHRRCYQVRSAWGSSELEEHDHMRSPYGVAWSVERGSFDRLLAERARGAGATLLTGCRPRAFDREGGGWRVSLSRPEGRTELHVPFVLDATGRRSRLRSRMGLTDHVHDRLVGIGVWFDRERGADGEAGDMLIEATRDGWWYSTRGSGGRRIVLYMTDLDSYRRGRRASPDFWNERLAESRHVRALVHGAPQVTRPRVHLASSHQVVALGPPGYLPIGDAMRSADPLYGRGLVDALESGAAAVGAVRDFLDGDLAAPDAFLRESQRAFTRYLGERVRHYAVERRWPDALFWARRARRAGSTSPTLPAEEGAPVSVLEPSRAPRRTPASRDGVGPPTGGHRAPARRAGQGP